ncbi:hypothetical protein OA88_08725 [Flavobacterium sp. JRM]|nr:hypothetical protein OA88_08725 [Flavobacterium sp. JRM]
MKELIIESKGIRTDQYFIPPFELREGEFVLIYLDNHIASEDVKWNLVDIFTGKTKHENVIVGKPLTYVKHFRESEFRRIFFPVTVGEYLFKNANSKSKFAKKIYEIDWVNKKTKVNRLPGNPRKLISLYSVLSRTKNVIFDVIGQDFQGIAEVGEIIKQETENGGAAILIDWTDKLKKDCTKYIKIEWIIGLEENKTVFDF